MQAELSTEDEPITESGNDANAVLYGVDWVERWQLSGFNFPFFALQNITTWSTIHSRVCPKCTQRLIREQKFLIVVDCIAKDENCNTNDEIKDKSKIVDYVDYNHKTKEWESVYGQKCSQCGVVANAVYNVCIGVTQDI